MGSLNFLSALTEFLDQYPFVKYGIVVIISFLLAFILSKLTKRAIRITSRKLDVDQTTTSFISNAISFLFYIGALIVIFFSIPQLRSLGVTLFAGASIATALILFASQQAFSNIINGIFIVIFKPFRVGDIIKIGELSNGTVEDVTLRHTVIRDFENRRVVVPNSQIGSDIIINSNITDQLIRNFVEFGISYDSDINKAFRIIQEEAQKHPGFIDNRTQEEKKKNVPPVLVRVIGFGDSSVNLRSYVWSKDHNSGFAMKCDLYKSVKERFDKEGIEIPFPYRTIVYKKDI
ncbi:MAG: mechanosensitive ion channel family protein [Bacteroidales bacterium]|nr:MAG: mechanosensitive ion channel family protein [Bacteroidales bacterium]